MTFSCLKLKNLLYLLIKDSCTIFILFLWYILLKFTSISCRVCSSNARAFFYWPCLLIDRGSFKDRRLQLWQEGKFEELPNEGRTIQKRQLRSGARHNNVNWVKSFSRFMFEWKVWPTLRLLNRAGGLSGQPLSLSDMVCKHPAPRPVSG